MFSTLGEAQGKGFDLAFNLLGRTKLSRIKSELDEMVTALCEGPLQ